MKLEDCSALITGASSGIGREFARQLAPRAKSLVLVARRRDRLEELKTELLARSPSLRVEIRETDLSNLEQTMELAKSLAEQPIDFLINNAGWAISARWWEPIQHGLMNRFRLTSWL